jgi:organic radical activating enzyme
MIHTIATKPITEVSEVFSSLQGEGPYLGQKQIFIRFGRCNMHCGYCDETEKMQPGGYAAWEFDALLDAVKKLESENASHHSISLTGGEPLVYVKFLKQFMPALKSLNFKLYLETNGTLPNALTEVLPWTDIVAMDLKPASSTGDKTYWTQHEEFLKIAAEKDLFVKLVVTPETAIKDVLRSVGLVRRISDTIPFIFQPLSELTGINREAMKRIENDFEPIASAILKDVRVIPQMHKIWNIR